ncbi:hypothetical protein BDY17DRAFT_249622 [Neohortaea acidophila]|uniref:Amidohydrolase-related domain-containing protein n=1 Tax=Neohortaea acidophila TaxID=245834 RepID=A0A6A6PVJ6_9PEZI|nr:uncharacterized protein BDY17DRAFT_249622 [Neohortaea acidophila]KAF2483493.1 hypothetical protein BDY17DRAFT_249622 [Neohortaea acidophila]
MLPPLIALEEHFFSTGVLNALTETYQEQFKHVPGLRDKIADLDQLRLSDMDKNEISMQVISHACVPGGPTVQQCIEGNDQLAAACKKHPNRFAGFAVLPMADAEESARELERTVRELGFVGALIDNRAQEKYYDGAEYDCVWKQAQDLDVPIYLHPTWPAESMAAQFTGNFTSGASRSLGASGWGWHADCGLHVLRLHAAGVFDRFPRLKIILGHFGEMLPFQLQRICNLSVRWGEIQRDFKTVWQENIWITTSGVWSLDPLRCILHNTPIDHIMFSVDYPLEKNENGLMWMKELEQSGLVASEQLEMIAYKNSEKLLKVKAPAR